MRFSRFIPAAFAALALLPAVATAQVQLKNIGKKFTGQYTTMGGGFGGGNSVDVGPYVSQYMPAGNQFDVFCIDAEHGFNAGVTYNAYVLTFDEAVSVVLSHGGTNNFLALQRVLGNAAQFGGQNTTQADFLKDLKTASQLVSTFGNAPADSWDEIHYAVWAMFAPTQSVTPDNGGVAAAQNRFDAASLTAAAPTYNYADWRIIIDANAWDLNYTGPLSQALITNVVPEPSTYALMGFGLIGLYGAARRRNRAAKLEA
ncbi:MAG: PEP-CTERM sorting domain-containing protein [Gemmatimonas sp.]